MHLRPAKPSDLALLRYWDTKPHVLAATGGNANWDWEAELAHVPDGRELLIAEIDERPLGFIQIMDPARDETHYWGEAEPGSRAIDIWIGEEADLGRGHGTKMMWLALARCFADHAVTVVLLDPLASNMRAHAVAKEVVVLHHHVAEIDADAEDYAALWRHLGLGGGHRLLQVHGATHGIDDGGELGKQAVAHRVDEAAVVGSK